MGGRYADLLERPSDDGQMTAHGVQAEYRPRRVRRLMAPIRALLHWPRTRETRMEAGAVGAIAIVFVLFLLPALGYARREYRDGVRRALLQDTKGELERWFNDHGVFPLHPSGDLGWCGSSADPDDWFFQKFLAQERGRPELAPRTWREVHALRYCPTARTAPERGNPPFATGFYLEAPLENSSAERLGFNAEHNIFERTLRDGSRTLYRVCGGIETQCGTELPE